MTAQILTVFLTVLIVIDPLGIVPVYIALAHAVPTARKTATILKSLSIAFGILCLFIFLGNGILRFLGILPGSFSVAGGILLFLVSMDMLLGNPRRTKTSNEAVEHQDYSVFPLAIPMLAGPGAITTILLFVSGTENLPMINLLLVASVLVTLLAAGLAMVLSSLILRVLGRTGVSVTERLMGIILAGLSVQFVYEGLIKLEVI